MCININHIYIPYIYIYYSDISSKNVISFSSYLITCFQDIFYLNIKEFIVVSLITKFIRMKCFLFFKRINLTIGILHYLNGGF